MEYWGLQVFHFFKNIFKPGFWINSMDPLFDKFPYWSPYHFAGNTPIEAREFEGLETWHTTTGETEPDPEATGGGPVKKQVGPLEPSLAFEEYGYTHYGLEVLDNSFSQDTYNEIEEMGKNNKSGDCWITYRKTSEILSKDPIVGSITWAPYALTNYLSNNDYFVDAKGELLTYNSGRKQINYGFKTSVTQHLNKVLENQVDGIYFFNAQVSNQFHNVTIITLKNSEEIIFQAYDQGQGAWFSSTPSTRSNYQLNHTLGNINRDRILYHMSGDGVELGTRIRQYTNSKSVLKLFPIDDEN